MSIFDDWTPKELAALENATKKLRDAQPKKPDDYYKPQIKGCHYDAKRKGYNIYIYVGKRRVLAGKIGKWDEGAALALQYEAEQKQLNNTPPSSP